MRSAADRRLDRVIRRQRGVFTWEQARQCGVPHSTIHSRKKSGFYVQVQPRVLMPAAMPDNPELRELAAVLAAGDGAVLSHLSAAHRWTLGDLRRPDHVDVLTTRKVKGLVGVRVHITSTLPDEHVTRRGPVPIAVAERTICDLAGQLQFRQVRKLVADALRLRLISVASLRDCVRRLGQFRGKRVVLAVLDELSALEGQTRNELESLFLRVTTAAGIPPTAMNYPIVDFYGQRRVLDAVYLPEKVPVELDGEAAHGSALHRNDDRSRENAAVLVGWRAFLRYGWWDLSREPGRVVGEITAALDAARADLSRRRIDTAL